MPIITEVDALSSVSRENLNGKITNKTNPSVFHSLSATLLHLHSLSLNYLLFFFFLIIFVVIVPIWHYNQPSNYKTKWTIMINRIISTPASKFRHFRRQVGEEQSRHVLWRSYQILSPDSDVVAHWNHLFLVTCLVALFIDPLYFFLPSVGGPACLSTDVPLGVALTFLRSVADLFFILHVLMKFRTAFVAPSSKIFGRGELVMDATQIALRYLKSDFLIDLAATLPLPQALFALISPTHSLPLLLNVLK